MKLRTQQHVLDAIDYEVAWRTKEISNICAGVKDTRATFVKDMARAAYPMVYAHWEGGVKKCASCYLEYVARQRLPYQDLKTNFVAIACATSIQQAAQSGQLAMYAQVVDFLTYNQGDRYQKPKTFEIQTESNLNTRVMDNICFNIGVSLGSRYELSRKFIDSNLLKLRNSIAHGGLDPIDIDFLIESKDKVLALLGDFRTELQNSVVQKTYLR